MGDYSGAESSEWKELNEGVEFPNVWKKKPDSYWLQKV